MLSEGLQVERVTVFFRKRIVEEGERPDMHYSDCHVDWD